MSTVDAAPKPSMSTARKLLLGVGGVWLGGIIFFVAVVGFGSDKASSVATGVFSPIDEFKLNTWFSAGPIAFNKGVLYVLLAAAITIGLLLYMAARLRQRPGRLQAAVEMFYDLTRQMSDDSLNQSMSRKYFPMIATLFIFILVSNLIGYIPLPIDTGQKFLLFGVHWPSFQIYAADTNVAFPLMLSLLVFGLFTFEGIRKHGPFGYVKSLMPDVSGVNFAIKYLIYGIEILSYVLRLISLTVRLWANLLAGHLLIAFMGGELGVLTGNTVVSWALLPFGVAIFIFEAVLIAGLQAFIFSILTAIYLGSAVSDTH
jgi:F-type H+-transporting ATPase subunit a